MIYVYPCDEQTCAAFGAFIPVRHAFMLYNLTTGRISYVASDINLDDELISLYRSAAKGNYRLPSHPPLYIYDPTQPEWQI